MRKSFAIQGSGAEREMGVCDIKHLDLYVNDAVDKEKCMKQNMSADS